MLKTLFVLLTITSNGNEYETAKNLTLEHCVARLNKNRNVLLLIQEKHPKVKVNFECRKMYGE